MSDPCSFNNIFQTYKLKDKMSKVLCLNELKKKAGSLVIQANSEILDLQPGYRVMDISSKDFSHRIVLKALALCTHSGPMVHAH